LSDSFQDGKQLLTVAAFKMFAETIVINLLAQVGILVELTSQAFQRL